jgi:glycosyltransferase involved in cell wall biosynthesis
MRVAHLLNYVSVDGAFGGPTAVATAQMTALARRGYDVELIAGWDGLAAMPIPGVSVRLYRSVNFLKRGFSAVLAPGILPAIVRNSRRGGVLHVHFGRDISSIFGSLIHLSLGGRLVCQTHGMVMPRANPLTRLFDAVATRPILSRAETVFALTAEEEAGLDKVCGGQANVERIVNGIESPSEVWPRKRNEVLFLARLHPRKRVMAFARAAQLLVKRLPETHFVVVGPDEGDLQQLQGYISENNLSERIRYEGSLAPGNGVGRIAQATAYVLPSRGEVFPMSILEALSVGTPVVTTLDSGIAPLLGEARAAIVTDGTAESLADAIADIIQNPATASLLAECGYKLVENDFSVEQVADKLIHSYTGHQNGEVQENQMPDVGLQ